MLFQPSNISPSTLSGIGAGTVDVTLGVTVSWQVNGDTPMTAYQITIYQNDSASTQKYTTGKITLSQPFQPHDKNGNPQFFSTQISAANLSSAGVVNGYANGYKLLITQWWSANDYVTQTSASVFNTLKNPTLTIDTISGTSISETITATYSQAQGDPVSTVEWIFAVAGSESDPIKQTGTVTTQILSFDVDGLMDGTTYSIECNVVTASGVYISTGFIQFTVSYSITTETLSYTLGQVNGTSGVYLSWDAMSATPITGYEVYRKESDIPYLKHVATTSSNLREVVDYAVASQATVKYVIISMNGTTQRSIGETSEITPVFWDYSILLCYTDADGYYHVNQEFRFGLSVETGAISNGNDPTMQLNFTKYPNRQPMASLYKSGTLKSYIGSSDSAYQYHDSISLQDAIYAISTSRLTKFYKNRKGDVLMVDTNAAISMQTMDNSPKQAMQATINWSEVGEARGESIISQPSDAFFPVTVTYVYEEVRGSVASFVSKYANEPLKSLTAAITPVQDLHGYDSPWPAGGGKNLANFVNGYSIASDGSIQANAKRIATVDPIKIESGVSYIYTCETGLAGIYSVFNNGTLVLRQASIASGTTLNTSGGTDLYVCAYGGSDYTATVANDKPMVRKSTEPAGYAPYSNECPITGYTGANIYVSPTQNQADATVYNVYWTSAAGTVYGGTLDALTGKLTVTMVGVDMGTLSWQKYTSGNNYAFYATINGASKGVVGKTDFLCSAYKAIPCATRSLFMSNGKDKEIVQPSTSSAFYIKDSAYTDKDAFASSVSGYQLVYTLEIPVEYTLTPQQVEALVGQNYVWSDTNGDVDLEYLKDKTLSKK